MISAGPSSSYTGISRIPHTTHSTTALKGSQGPRGARHESIACAALPDVGSAYIDFDFDFSLSSSGNSSCSPAISSRPLPTSLPPQQRRTQYDVRSIPTTDISTTIDKVDSRQQRVVPSSVKSKAHSRLASFGRQTLRGIVQTNDVQPQGETLQRVPVSPSDVGSQHKPSNASTRSNTSSETALTDDSKSDIKSFEDRPSREDAAPWAEPGRAEEERQYQDTEAYERILRRSPRMMHQTSSKLLKMTGDDQPYTRVC